MIAATLFALIALGCGDERPPWAGFPLLPPDASTFELSPQLASSLAAAEAAFVAQFAAEQGVGAAGAATAPDVSPNSADAGLTLPSRMAAETKARPGNSGPAGEAQKPSGPDAEMIAAAGGRAAAGSRSVQPMQPVAPDLDAGAPTGAAGRAGASGSPGQPPQPSEIDAGSAMVAGAGGQAGSLGPTVTPPQPSGPDAGSSGPDADGGD